MKLSIIICLYNTKKRLLCECLHSLTSSTLDYAEYEIIIVDDGSESDYGEIAYRYNARYERLPRGGTLSARLHGISLARGEYITFVDSDDTVGFNYHLPMITRADQGFDIVFNAWAFHSEGTKYFCSGDDSVSGRIESNDPLATYLSREGRQHSYYVLWNKVYRAEILRRAAEELSRADAPHPFCFSEDALINLFAFKHAGRVSSIKTGYYFYRIHRDQTVNITSREKLLYQIDCMSYTLNQCKEAVAGIENEWELLAKIEAWASLMARGHFAGARGGGYTDIYPYIKKKYGKDELAMPTEDDGAVYERVKLLPGNAAEIENALLSLCGQGDVIRVKRPRRGGYAQMLLLGLALIGKTVEYGKAYPGLPREKMSLLKRLLFSAPVRRIGARLFKKGSRIRAFLKRFI